MTGPALYIDLREFYEQQSEQFQSFFRLSNTSRHLSM